MKTPTKEQIKDFIGLYAIPATEDEDESWVELIMDDHFFIEYEGMEYYIPENSILYSTNDEEIASYLKDHGTNN